MGALQKHPEESNNDTLYTLDRKVHHLYVTLLLTKLMTTVKIFLVTQSVIFVIS